ncbi:MAG: gliding motility-associated C-terminal domain-containing protein, partial [Pedobacter sp.]|nr:gliding motility-associated C-terminal domain-containing protein [Chitinophagaceae bacterium]
LISGTAPATIGEYVLAVYVQEWRNGVMINATKKELQINVANCSLSAASLKLSYINCDNFIFNFQNESSSSSITSYLWDFGVTTSTKDTSTQPTPTYTYADTGVYVLKLSVANSGGCKDSAKSIVKVYPGFTPAFTVSGSCFQSPFIFTDASTTSHGFIDSWLWDFGDPNVTTDTSTQKNIAYQYSASGNTTANLTVTNSKGCIGTVAKPVIVNDKPQIILPFKDTLICSIDSVPLKAKSNGLYTWTPNYNIINPNSANPIVFPKDTTVYTVTVADKGCIDSAKITVNVLNFITVKLSADTGVCKTDSAILSPISDALNYVWRENGGGKTLSSYSIKYPKASPITSSVTYYVTANLGYCQDSAKITVHTSPYPTAIVSADTVICFGNRAALTGTITGAYFSWFPSNSLLHGNTLQPIAGPQKTTAYILSVSDTIYCPKTVTDTVIVTVVPLFNLNAGRDTSIVLGQPLQLAATGDTTALQYVWQPATHLNNNTIYNPVATINNLASDFVTFTVKATTKEGCFATDDILVKVYKIAPDILIPTGFTPNGDGKNDVLKPILIGINKLDFFSVYNRFGQLIYTTSENNKGWDGTINGTQQMSGTYVFMAQGTDYLGKVIFKKGTVVLVR